MEICQYTNYWSFSSIATVYHSLLSDKVYSLDFSISLISSGFIPISLLTLQSPFLIPISLKPFMSKSSTIIYIYLGGGEEMYSSQSFTKEYGTHFHAILVLQQLWRLHLIIFCYINNFIVYSSKMSIKMFTKKKMYIIFGKV